MEHLRLEPWIHAVLGPLCVGVEIQIPIVYSRNVYAIPVKLNHIHMVAAIRIAILVLDDDEERIRRYGVSSVHDLYKSTDSLIPLQEFCKPCEDYFSKLTWPTFATVKTPNRLHNFRKSYVFRVTKFELRVYISERETYHSKLRQSTFRT